MEQVTERQYFQDLAIPLVRSKLDLHSPNTRIQLHSSCTSSTSGSNDIEFFQFYDWDSITGTPEQQPNKWGLSEAELFLSKGAPTEGRIFGEQAAEPTTDAIVTRRLLISVGITILAVGLAFVSEFHPCFVIES
jgi:hypothetical protein